MHTTTSLVVAPGLGWTRNATILPLLKGDAGPDRGRFGSVNTALNKPGDRGIFRGPCLEVKSPALHERGLSVEQSSGLLEKPSSRGRSPQVAGSDTVPILRVHSKGMGESPGACLLLRCSESVFLLLLMLVVGVAVGAVLGSGANREEGLLMKKSGSSEAVVGRATVDGELEDGKRRGVEDGGGGAWGGEEEEGEEGEGKGEGEAWKGEGETGVGRGEKAGENEGDAC